MSEREGRRTGPSGTAGARGGGPGVGGFHGRPRLPRGFRCAGVSAGLKEGGARDLAVFLSDREAAAAALFTRNRFPGAPVVVGRRVAASGRLRAVVVNSRIANVATGARGIRNVHRMAAAAARALGVRPEEVLVASTGVIGRQLPIERLEEALSRIPGALGDDPLPAAEAMMTTDTHPKALSLEVEGATLTVVGKGSGMIAPNLATMLVFLFTDARLDAPALDRRLRAAADETFNMLSVDSDTSTSDTVAILANGAAGPVPEEAFGEALRAGCLRMTELLARDGEGATKLLRVRVRGARDREEARTVARSVVNSPLVKTMVFGGDPNVGRILMAVGKCADCRIVPERIRVRISGTLVFRDGERPPYDEGAVRRLLEGDPVEIEVELGVGDGEATAFGCDLTHGYIDENAAYYST